MELTYAQQAAWFVDSALGLRNSLNGAVRVETPAADLDTLAAALATEMARAGLTLAGVQEAAGRPAWSGSRHPADIVVHDLRQARGAGRQAVRIEAAAASAPFDLGRGPLGRCRLIRLVAGRTRIVLAAHQSAADRQGLLSVIERALGRAATPAPAVPAQAPELTAERWRARLKDYPPTCAFPAERARTPGLAGPSAMARRRIGPAQAAGLRTAAQALDVTAAELFAAAVLLVLQRYCGAEDLMLGDAVRLEGEPTETPTVLRLDLAAGETLAGATGRTVQALRTVRAEAGAGLATALAELGSPAQARIEGPARVQVRACRCAGEIGDVRLAAGGRLSGDLTFSLLEAGERLDIFAEYRTDLFSAGYARQILRHLAAMLGEIRRRPQVAIPAARLLGPAERRRMIQGLNQTRTPTPDVLLHRLFEAAAAAAPDALAVSARDGQLTYGALNGLANGLARRLAGAHGLQPGEVVGICLPRDRRMVIALMAVAKAGGAYLPLDPAQPPERLRFMVADSGCRLLITTPDSATFSAEAKPICLDETFADSVVEADNLPDQVPGGSPFYLIYTSGSTGEPKGVLLNHAGRTNNFLDFVRRFRIGPGDRLLGVSSIGFDMCAFDVFGILAAGAALVLVDTRGDPNPRNWAARMRDEGVTIWHSAPALLTLVLEQLEAARQPLERLRLALLGGDWIPLDQPARLRALAPASRFVSLGGATECSMDSTIHEVDRVDPDWASIPYGVPMANQTAYVLDANLEPTPFNIAGDLYLGGAGVGEGYLGRPDLTRQRFIANPFPDGGERLYLTGDVARWRREGWLELLGRSDFQVKINGHRVELGEIERVLRDAPGVRQAVVTLVRKPDLPLGLAAYVTGADGPPDSEAVREHARRRLPSHMTPAWVMALDSLPLSPNGKVNRLALPEPAVLAAATAAPASPAEAVLARLFQRLLGQADIGAEDDLFDRNLDSLGMLRAMALLPASIGPLDFLRSPTVRDLARRILDQAGEPALLDYGEADEVSDRLQVLVSPAQAGLDFGDRAAAWPQARLLVCPGPERDTAAMAGWAEPLAERIAGLAARRAELRLRDAGGGPRAVAALAAALASHGLPATVALIDEPA